MNDVATPNRPPAEDSMISVVLPVYNEAEALPVLCRSITEVTAPFVGG